MRARVKITPHEKRRHVMALQEQFHLGNLNLPCFSKKVKKAWEQERENTWTLKIKTKDHRWKHRKGIEIHRSQIANHDILNCWSKLLFPKWSARKRRAFKLWLMSQKNRKSKDVFDITGSVLSSSKAFYLNARDNCFRTIVLILWQVLGQD